MTAIDTFRASFRQAISKRRFLQLLGGTALAASLRPAFAAADRPYDVIVIGGGTAGMPAAIFTAQRGGRVLVIEAAESLGGTLYWSGGMMSAAGTKLQKSKGIVDTPQDHFDDIMRISKGTADPDIVRLAVFNAAETFDWLVDSGLEIPPQYPILGPPLHDPYSIARYATGPKGGRSVLATLMTVIQPYIDSGKITVLTRTEATKLIQDGSGHVVGVETKDAGGNTQSYMARNVALTSGGYSSNSEMFEKLEGHKRYTAMSSPHSQGIGITLGLAAGGFVRGGEKHLPLFGAVMADDEIPSRSIGGIRQWIPDREPWEIMVNARGERFYAEDVPSFDPQEHALVKQPDERAWAVFDDAIFNEAPPLLKGGNWSHESVAQAFDSQHPSFYKANTLEELAKLASIDGKGLTATVAAYNKAQKSGKDAAFGRTHMPRPIAKAPFYAIRIQGYVLTSFAGLGVNNELQVIRKDGTAIPGLYAAGELLGTGQLMGNSYCGGMTVTPSVTFGRLMGQKFFQLEA